MSKMRGTTILGLRHNGEVAIGGDGQVTLGDVIMKHNSSKIRKLWNESILVGFAGAAGDAQALLERFEEKLNEYNGNLVRSSVELVKEWKTDRYLRHLEALLVVMDREHSLLISGDGDLIEPDDGIIGIGSGGPYALAATRAYLDSNPKLNARTIVERALRIASSICVYTNAQIKVEELTGKGPDQHRNPVRTRGSRRKVSQS